MNDIRMQIFKPLEINLSDAGVETTVTRFTLAITVVKDYRRLLFNLSSNICLLLLARLTQEPAIFYRFQLHTAHKNFPIPPIAGPPKPRARVLQHPCIAPHYPIMRHCPRCSKKRAELLKRRQRVTFLYAETRNKTHVRFWRPAVLFPTKNNIILGRKLS